MIKNQTQVSCIAGRFFTDWATREAPKDLNDFQINLFALEKKKKSCKLKSILMFPQNLKKKINLFDCGIIK